MICTCVPAPVSADRVIHYFGPVSFERERFPYADFGGPYEPPAVVHYYGPVSFERQRYPYADFGRPFDPHEGATAAAETEPVAEEPARAAPLSAATDTEKDDETAIIAAIMDEPPDDKALQFAVILTSASVHSNMAEGHIAAPQKRSCQWRNLDLNEFAPKPAQLRFRVRPSSR